MRFSFTRIATITALAAALGLGASRASAQTATFTLPYEAHWGTAVLEPGHYKLSTPYSVSPIRIFYLRGDTSTQALVPAIVNQEDNADRSYLKLVNVGGTYYVREYVSGATGHAFKFAVPKEVHRETMSQVRVLAASESN